MNGNTDTSKKSAGSVPASNINSECPARWVIHCISCETPVEPWQTTGYQFGFCAHCFGIIMEPETKS